MKKIFFIILTLYVIQIFSACRKSSDNDIKEIPIETIAAAAPNIDLNKRKAWLFYGGDNEYIFNIINDTLQGVPKNKPYYLRLDTYQNLPFNYIGFSLVSPTYSSNIATFNRTLYMTSPQIPPFPNIADQSNQEKLRNADALITINYETPTKNIKDANFVHRNTLIDFETIGIPENAEVTVIQQKDTKPYNYKEHFYKAIVVSIPSISIKIDNNIYKADVYIGNEAFTADTHYKFKVAFNAETKSLSLSDYSWTKWSDEPE